MTWPTFKGSTNAASLVSMRDRFANAAQEQAQVDASETLMKSHAPFLMTYLNQVLSKGLPIKVLRPLSYETCKLDNDLDDGFYYKRDQGAASRFVDVVETIPVGTELMFKAVDSGIQEILFTDRNNKEYAIPFTDKQKLVTKTNVFEDAQQYLTNLT